MDVNLLTVRALKVTSGRSVVGIRALGGAERSWRVLDRKKRTMKETDITGVTRYRLEL